MIHTLYIWCGGAAVTKLYEALSDFSNYYIGHKPVQMFVKQDGGIRSD